MKNLKPILFSVALCAAAFLTSCTPTEEAIPAVIAGNNVLVNTGNLKLFVIDTAKVNTITMTGTNETTILNRKVNSNSYIGGLSLNNDASKFVYVDNQGSMVNGGYVGVSSIRTANANGTSDASIYTAPANTTSVNTSIGFVKYGASKIYFTTTTQTVNGPTVNTITKLNAANFDGTNLVQSNYSGSPLSVFKGDITSDGKYLCQFQSAPNLPKFLIIDRTGDNGAGTVVFQENINSNQEAGSGAVFSYDDKFAYFAFAENQELKVRILDMTTRTATTKTIATNFTPTSSFISISVASDNNRGVVVVDSYNNLPTKSYVFNLATGTSTVFNNNDKTVDYVKAF